MKPGKAFEILVRQILLCVGFSQVAVDGMYIFDKPSVGLMIQGLAEAHNADVLLEPPVQTPFYSRTRLLIECKDHTRRVGLNTIRSALGLREDINHFNIVDSRELVARRNQKRRRLIYNFDRCSYQVAVASMSGFSIQGQNFAAAHRIPLIEFDKMPFWEKFCQQARFSLEDTLSQEDITEEDIVQTANQIGSHMAIAITNSGQMLFLYRIKGMLNQFGDTYSLHWRSIHSPWILRSANQEYLFQLPDTIMQNWLENANTELEKKQSAIDCKEQQLSHMVVYYREQGLPTIKMISISQGFLAEARAHLK